MSRALLVLALVAPLLAVGAARGGGDCPTAWGVALDGYPVDAGRLEAVAAESGVAPRMVCFFLQWPADPGRMEFPQASLEAIGGAGAVPVITWEPMFIIGRGLEKTILAEDILNGAYDAYIAAFAEAARAYGGPLIIRFGHEMNLKRYHWGVAAKDYGPAAPELYQRMFRHVVGIFRARSAANVRWAFCPNAESQPHPRWDGAAWNTASAYWPGKEWVDILGMDGYNWGTTQNQRQNGWQSRWQSFEDIFGELHAELRALAPGKPLVVFETSCADRGGDRAAWVLRALEICRRWRVAALGWFQADKEVDWRLGAAADARAVAAVGAATAAGSAAELWKCLAPGSDRR